MCENNFNKIRPSPAGHIFVRIFSILILLIIMTNVFLIDSYANGSIGDADAFNGVANESANIFFNHSGEYVAPKQNETYVSPDSPTSGDAGDVTSKFNEVSTILIAITEIIGAIFIIVGIIRFITSHANDDGQKQQQAAMMIATGIAIAIIGPQIAGIDFYGLLKSS